MNGQSEPAVLINPFEVPPEGDDAFQFINVGWYASPRAFQAAISSPGFQETARRIPYRPHPGLYRVVRQ
jgi:hypothetical protein